MHLTNLNMQGTNTTAGFSNGFFAENGATILSSVIVYVSPQDMACGFVADGGSIIIDESRAHSSGSGTALFCTLGPDNNFRSSISAKGVVASAPKGSAVRLAGNTELAAFENCTLRGGGEQGVIINTRVPVGEQPATTLRVMNSTIISMNDTPALLFELGNISATLYNTVFEAPESQSLLLTGCSRSRQPDTCAPFDADVIVSESSPSGNIEA